jgi:hypothetical protein
MIYFSLFSMSLSRPYDLGYRLYMLTQVDLCRFIIFFSIFFINMDVRVSLHVP